MSKLRRLSRIHAIGRIGIASVLYQYSVSTGRRTAHTEILTLDTHETGEQQATGGGEAETGQLCGRFSAQEKDALRGIGDWDAEKGTLRGESEPEDDESSEPGMACGSKRGMDDEVCSGLSSSFMRASRRATVSRRSCVRVLPLPSSYSQRSCFLARTHCWQEGFAPSQR